MCYVITSDEYFAWAIEDIGIEGVEKIYSPNKDKTFNQFVYKMTREVYEEIIRNREKLCTSDWYCVFDNSYHSNNFYKVTIKDKKLLAYFDEFMVMNFYNDIMTDVVNKYHWTELYWCPRSLQEVPSFIVAGVQMDNQTFDNFCTYAKKVLGEYKPYAIFNALVAVAELNELQVEDLLDLL